ncbi:MAG: hypothetical protein QNJ65_04655 [Xenococcaceae cyanobacterium MO_234.B1]|nr:hypothetical protein [Xenococcaceae cyanobacterium MO_234.B1]
MKQLVLILVCLWLWLMAPALINASPVEAETNSQVTEQLVQPVETYYLSVLAGAKTEVKINPPATKIVITSQSGDTTIWCGDEQNAYSCSPGKRLELDYEVTTPLVKFWGENLSDTQVRLQIDVYQTVPLEDSSAERGQTNPENENIISQSQS